MTTDDGLLSRVALRFRQRVCGLHGHDSLLHFEKGRMSLLCSSCGHESPGWDVSGAQEALGSHERAAVAAATTPVVSLPYTGERRVA